ncbi:hypothetical protein ASF43_10540 [Pseudorhodoferax sp. Leaf267]|nr:hypothetical protein ASF43_10540 [Pseudorhodoferax sp. Leaf267]
MAWAADCPSDTTKTNTLALTRADGPADAEIAVDRPRLDTAWVLRNCSSTAVVVTLPKVTLHGPSGAMHDLEWWHPDLVLVPERDPGLRLPARDARLLLLRSAKDAGLYPGLHTAAIRAESDQDGWAPLLATFRVKYAVAKPPEAIASAPVTSHYANLFHRPKSIEYRIPVRGSAAAGAAPVLSAESLTRKTGDDAKWVEALAAPEPTASAVVVRNGTGVYALRFDNVQSPGRYDAQLRLHQPGYADTTAPLTFYVRDQPGVAFLFILLGVVASYLMSLYGVVWRPRLLAQVRLGTIFDHLGAAEAAARGDADATALVHRVLEGFKTAVKDTQPRRTPLDDATVQLYADIARALPSWSATIARLKALRPESVGQEMLSLLSDHAQALVATPLDPVKVKAALDALADMPRTAAAKAAAALDGAIKTFANVLSSAASQDAGFATAHGHIIRAQELSATGRVQEALGAYDAAVQAYVDHYAQRLAVRADLARKEPGVVETDWHVICEDTQQALKAVAAARSGEAKLRGLQQAARVFLLACADSLRRYAAAEHPDKLDAVNARLADLKTALDGGDVATAFAQFEAVADALGQQRAGQGMGAAGGPGAAAPAFDAVQVFALPTTWEAVSAVGAVASTEATLHTTDRLLSLLVLVVASMAGLGVVWAKDPAWGGWSAYLGAFLFGLAADQFTKSGVAALRALKP